ncbi:MAG: biotin transporter BioY [Lactobacillales bacterium]|jgi:biotin transport system substrate-specific component|nr:biotin transporter BioY [Lactobacillales bacterium]
MNKLSLRELVYSALFAAVISVLAQFTIPLPLVPLTLQTFAVGLTVTIIGKKSGTYAVLIYLLIGMLGVPVFAGGASGIGVLFGPTGGYLLGFLLNTLVTGEILERKGFSIVWANVANIVGALVTLLFGTIWLKVVAGLPWQSAWTSGFVLFILPGIVKAVAASFIGVQIRNRLPQRFFSMTKN